ncbi:MAG TPA: hypothetical protein PLR35_03240 [Burkholderiaceae bacterium]|nr:hypothetical protein [Burkholderiaceae bacterium]
MDIAAADPRIDASLRFLSLLVSGAIVLALLWYLLVLIEPWIDLERWQGATPIIELDPLSTMAPQRDDANAEVGPPASAALRRGPFVSAPVQLIAPAFTVFRCERKGRVTYSDQPCDAGGMRVVRLPRS